MSTGLAAFGIFFAAIFTNNILLTNYLGMCSFLAISKEIKASFGLGIAVVFVMACTSAINWLVHYYILVPLGITYLGYVAYIIVIAAFVQLVEMVIERVSDALYNALGIFLPLITVNCAVLGVVLFMIIRRYSLLTAFLYGAGSGIGWALAIIAMAGIRVKLGARAKVPYGLTGAGITLIIAGIMALAFIGFTGMISIT